MNNSLRIIINDDLHQFEKSRISERGCARGKIIRTSGKTKDLN